MLATKLMGGSSEKLYVDSVFSTFLYTGNGSTQTINNGFDLAGESGMVWIKSRSDIGTHHTLYDTQRGAGRRVNTSHSTNEQDDGTNGVSYSASGFTIGGSQGHINKEAATYVSWTFRKAPKFFDIVTYTGDGVAGRQIPHELGIAPGMITTKPTSTTGDWHTYHRSATGDLSLNRIYTQTASRALVTAASGSAYTVSDAANTNGVQYVAYLYAHDDSEDGIIQCGSYTGNGSLTGPIISLGWEPQYLMIKNASGTGDWQIIDSMRRMPMGSADATLQANTSNAESSVDYVSPTATGFQVTSTSSEVNTSGSSYIYLAIRRPNKPPTTGTEVYYAHKTNSEVSSTASRYPMPFSPDMLISSRRYTSSAFQVTDRLRGIAVSSTGSFKALVTNSNAAESSLAHEWWCNPNVAKAFGYSTATNGGVAHFFKRAPGFFDVVCYTGTGVARTVPHSLGVEPELMIIKSRSDATHWMCYLPTIGAQGFVALSTAEAATSTGWGVLWNATQPSVDAFSVGTTAQTNGLSRTFVAYLFASLPGISKVGSYTGNGTSQTIPCGFTTGARFVLIKRTDSEGDWMIADTARGIVAAADPRLSLNTTAAEVTGEDWLDPDPTGFIVNQVAGSNANVDGASYIFLSIA